MIVDKHRVIEALYGVLSDPLRYEELVRQLDESYRVVFDGGSQSSSKDSVVEIENHFDAIEPHFERVAQVFERFRFVGTRGESEASAIDSKAPIIEFGENGTILSANAAAIAMLGIKTGDKVDAIELDCGAHLLLRRTLRRIANGGGNQSFTFLQAYTKDHTTRLMLMLSAAPAGRPNHPIATLQGVDLSWRPEIGAAIGSTFDLTMAELDILQGIVAGFSLSEIAVRKSRSLATIRTQAKALLRKTEAKSQLELVRLFSAMSLAAPALGNGEARSNGRRTFMLKREDERLLQVDVFGPEDGNSILFVHGFVTGTAMTDDAVDFLQKEKLRIIAPWRPAFAGSSPLKGSAEAYVQTISDDIRLVMDRFGLDSVTLASRDSGVIYATAAAKLLGRRANGVVAIAGTVPTRSRHQLDHIALWQRMFAYSARYFPAALPVLARGAMEMITAGKLDKLLEGLYARPAIDAACAYGQQVSGLLRDSFEATFVQGTKGYEIDARQTATDWSAQSLDGLTAPILYIHGRHDPISVLSQVEELAGIYPQISIEVIEDGGQLIWYSHSDVVLQSIARFARRLSKQGA